MTAPHRPDDWRRLLAGTFSEPELSDEEAATTRRQQRRARKAARIRQRRHTRDAIDAERRREPVTTAGGAALILAVLLTVGLITRWATGDDAEPPAADASPAATADAGTEQPAPAAPTPTALTPEPTDDAAAAVDLSDPDQVAREWATAYLTRNPPDDGDHTAAVERATPWMTPALAENLVNHDDPLFAKLVSHGGIATVTSVTVTETDGDLGADTPLRVWRDLTVTVSVEGYTDHTNTHGLQAEITDQADGWRITRVLGL